MKWFRFWTDTVNDVKMLQLSDYEYRMWTYLLSYASETDSLSGQLQITFKLLSLHFHQRFNLFSRAIETFQRVGLITISSEGYITITNWNKRQFKSDNAYDRVKKHREVTLKRNVSVTAPDTDTDTDTDTDIRKKPEYSDDFVAFWTAYPKKSGSKKAAFDNWKKLNGCRPELSIILVAIKNQIDWRASANGEFRPEWKDPERWIRGRMWEAETIPIPTARGKPPRLPTQQEELEEFNNRWETRKEIENGAVKRA